MVEPSTDEDAGRVGTRTVPPSRLRWLQAELADWQEDGLLTPQAAAAIRGRYVAGTRSALLSLVVGLGAAFLAVGLLWLVAVNLERFAPGVRFGAVVALWLGLAVLGQVLAPRNPASPGHGTTPTLASVCRLLAAAAFGAVIFQAAQSLQVPAYEPRLVGAWALGALVYAYVVNSRGALAVALGATAVWFGWFVGERAGSLPVGIAMVLAGAVVATGLALAHPRRLAAGRPDVVEGWRLLGAAVALAGLFVGSFPIEQGQAMHWPVELIVLLVLAAVMSALAVGTARRGAGTDDRGSGHGVLGPVGQVAAVVAMLGAGWGLALWRPAMPASPADLTAANWAHTAVTVVVFVAAAAWFAALGAAHESPVLTGVALAALVVFTTWQSFAVFAPIISGATLFLAVGAVMVGAGLAAERLRRTLRRPRRGRAGRGGGEGDEGGERPDAEHVDREHRNGEHRNGPSAGETPRRDPGPGYTPRSIGGEA